MGADPPAGLPAPLSSPPGDLARLNETPGAAALYLAELAPGSRRAASWRLDQAARLAGRVGPVCWASLSYPEALTVRGRAVESYAPRTAAAIVAAMRGACRAAWRAGDMPGETWRRIADLPAVKGRSAPVGRYVSGSELRALFDACGDGPAGLRDRCLLAVLFGAGLRRAEAAALMVSDLGDASIVVQSGKGSRGRSVPLPPAAVEVARAWISARGDHAGPLLSPVNRGGRVGSGAISGEAIRLRLRVLAERAGVPPIRPHDARRTYASAHLDNGVDLVVVARLMGNRSIQVTAGYDRRGERAAREAADRLALPVDPIR